MSSNTVLNKEFDIVSVGDCVMDCIMYVDRMPKMGETMRANNFVCLPGGKGANSIVASSRLGSNNTFVTKLGNDMFGKDFIQVLQKDRIDITNATFTDSSPTSVATILVDTSGKNAIAVNFGATLELNESDVDKAEETIKKSKILVTTRMVNESVALYSLKMAKKHNLISVFNFAPAEAGLSPEFDQYIDLLIVNEVEAEVFIGKSVKSIEDAIKACEIILKREGFYLGCVVTLGELGSVYGDKKTSEITHFDCLKVKAVDSTGAGDAFVGSLCHYISKLGVNSIKKAVELASEYASLSVQYKGTQASYPYLHTLDEKFKC